MCEYQLVHTTNPNILERISKISWNGKSRVTSIPKLLTFSKIRHKFSQFPFSTLIPCLHYLASLTSFKSPKCLAFSF